MTAMCSYLVTQVSHLVTRMFSFGGTEGLTLCDIEVFGDLEVFLVLPCDKAFKLT